EILVAARLQHPLIVPVIGTGGNGDLLYFTMPFVEGESLRARIAREGALPIPDVLRIIRDVSAALAAAHAQGVVHRDVKPDNILLSGGFAMVTDFGVAKALERARAPGSIGGTAGSYGHTPALETLTALGTSLGTPPYMSPEQAAGDGRIDQRSDLYSLGATAYEMLTGTPPFEGASVQAVIAAHLTRLPEPPSRRRASVPPALEALVMRLLEKDPADRSQSAAEVQRVVEEMLVAPTTSLPSIAIPTPATVRGRGLPKGVLIAAVAALALGAVGIARWRSSLTRAGDGGGPTATEAQGESSGIRSIAVLPFVNASADAGNEYFSDGVSEELIDALAKVGGVRVASRSSSFAFKGKNLAARTIAESLGVQAMIEGSVRSAEGRLRITAQLTRASDGSALWSQKYDRESRDVFAVQEELARAILGAVRDRLSGRPVAVVGSSPLVRHGTADPQAYELYLRGRYFWNQRSRDGFVRAAEYFAQAIARDSGNARAWSGLADSQCILANFGYRPASEVCPKSEVAARHAIALDSTLAEAHASLGFVQFFYRWDLEAGKRELERALALDSTYANAQLWLSQLVWARGDTTQMLARM
ncbi:MAG: protein kinase, partial [Gemmatimonadaceae bacterium]